MARPGFREDVRELLAAARVGGATITPLKLLALDGFSILAMTRLRELVRRFHIPLVNTILRRLQMMMFGIELGNEITLGPGVYFIHSLGIVIGGNSQVGARVRFFGNNTVGTAKENGYPIIEDDVQVSCGARILGPVRIGARSVIGANAVVLSDVPPDSVAVGIPARARPRSAT